MAAEERLRIRRIEFGADEALVLVGVRADVRGDPAQQRSVQRHRVAVQRIRRRREIGEEVERPRPHAADVRDIRLPGADDGVHVGREIQPFPHPQRIVARGQWLVRQPRRRARVGNPGIG
jgi:hypothetical protein